jgi:hypothetical protein
VARRRRQHASTNPPQAPVGRWPPETTSSADVEAAIVAGEAAAFSQVITFIRRYREAWWLSTDAGWLRVRPAVAVVLDEQAERMRRPDGKDAANAAAIRAVIELAREATKAVARHQPNV